MVVVIQICSSPAELNTRPKTSIFPFKNGTRMSGISAISRESGEPRNSSFNIYDRCSFWEKEGIQIIAFLR